MKKKFTEIHYSGTEKVITTEVYEKMFKKEDKMYQFSKDGKYVLQYNESTETNYYKMLDDLHFHNQPSSIEDTYYQDYLYELLPDKYIEFQLYNKILEDNEIVISFNIGTVENLMCMFNTDNATKERGSELIYVLHTDTIDDKNNKMRTALYQVMRKVKLEGKEGVVNE